MPGHTARMLSKALLDSGLRTTGRIRPGSTMAISMAPGSAMLLQIPQPAHNADVTMCSRVRGYRIMPACGFETKGPSLLPSNETCNHGCARSHQMYFMARFVQCARSCCLPDNLSIVEILVVPRYNPGIRTRTRKP